MHSSIKFKIMIGYVFVAILLLSFSLYAIYQLGYLRRSINNAFQENYQSIIYASQMTELSGLIDSDLLSVFSDHQEAPSDFETHTDRFRQLAALADSNITIIGEELLINNIRNDFDQYVYTGTRFFQTRDRDKKFTVYTQEIQPIFQRMKDHIYELLNLNQSHMYDIEQSSRDRAGRTIIAGIVTSVIALLLSLFWGWAIGYSISKPLETVAQTLEKGEGKPDVGKLPISTGHREIDLLIHRVRDLFTNGGRDK